MTRNSRFPVRCILSALACMLTVNALLRTAPALAAEPSTALATAEIVEVGIQGLYKSGQWTQVRIRLVAEDLDSKQPVSLLAPDPEGALASYPGRLASPASRPGEYQFFVRCGQMKPTWDIAYTTRTGERHTRRLMTNHLHEALPSDAQVVISIGSDLQLPAALGLRSSASHDRVASRHLSSADMLPRHWLAYSLVDHIFLTTANEWLEAVDDAQWRAMRTWVEMGGYLFVSADTRRPQLFDADGPLAWAVGGSIQGTATMRQTSNLEQFAAATRRLDRLPSSDSAETGLRMFQLAPTGGRVDFREGLNEESVPALLRHAVGFGRVAFLNFALDTAPLSSWVDRPRLIARLLDMGLDAPLDDPSSGGEGGPTTHLGYKDLTGQLHRALEQFPRVAFVPFSWIAGLALAYLTCVGPLDFWLLRRAKRSSWTWGSSLAVVLAFCLGMIYLASYQKQSNARANQLSIVDVDSRTGLVRGSLWSHLYSPITSVQDLRLHPVLPWETVEPFSSLLGWEGLSGNGFGGVDRTDGVQDSANNYQVVTNATPPDRAAGELVGFPIAIRASRSIGGLWWARFHPLTSGNLEASGEDLLRGEVQNPFPEDLRDAYLIYDRWAYPLGTLSAGSRVSIDESMAIDLQTMLTDRRIVDGRSVTPPWDRQSTDIPRIAQTIMFYTAAKGQQYTGLHHRYQRFLDWSNHVRLGQAVLWGQAAHSFTPVYSSAGPVAMAEDCSFCRILIPVRDAKRGEP